MTNSINLLHRFLFLHWHLSNKPLNISTVFLIIGETQDLFLTQNSVVKTNTDVLSITL